MKYDWDPHKNKLNFQKHGLSFEDAQYVFLSETITFEDNRNDYGENRYITLGELEGRIVIIVHTTRHHITRIISMRKANAREQKIYQQRLKESR